MVLGEPLKLIRKCGNLCREVRIHLHLRRCRATDPRKSSAGDNKVIPPLLQILVRNILPDKALKSARCRIFRGGSERPKGTVTARVRYAKISYRAKIFDYSRNFRTSTPRGCENCGAVFPSRPLAPKARIAFSLWEKVSEGRMRVI